ncbi:MAG: nucleotidyltransferase family protein [Anaerolineae bacterium]|nr:nucleotidyltransferase family protein [Anaerolineae bacterium]
MDDIDQIQAIQEQLTDFCRRWEVSELALFGSVLRADFRPDSDVDLLVSFAPSARRTLFDIVKMQDELEGLLGRKVDLVERRAIERSENYIRRRSILRNTKVIYAQR